MAIKSENVAPQKKTGKVESAPVVEDINLRTENPEEKLLAAMTDYEEAVKKMTGGKVLMKMERENFSFVTPTGVVFTKENPYQLVDVDEVDVLLRQNFRKAYPEEVREYYSGE